MATNLRGVMAALLTPFDQQQALDKASLRRLVQFNIQQGIDGLYAVSYTHLRAHETRRHRVCRLLLEKGCSLNPA
ncbi:dihydrodipicolinate synthase family protein, partial [Escherichia coli]